MAPRLPYAWCKPTQPRQTHRHRVCHARGASQRSQGGKIAPTFTCCFAAFLVLLADAEVVTGVISRVLDGAVRPGGVREKRAWLGARGPAHAGEVLAAEGCEAEW